MPPGEDGLYTLLMDNNALVQLIVDALDDVKGQDIRVYDTTDKTSAFERGSLHVTALDVGQGESVALLSRRHGVLVDCGSVIVHCMQPAVRDYYNLAELWGPTPMKRPAEPA